MKVIDISTKTFPDTFVMVDDDDYGFLSQWKWHPSMDKASGHLYAKRNPWKSRGETSPFKMHRVIAKCDRGMVCDHANRNTLDNRKENLRVCTVQDNRRNSKKSEPKGARSPRYSQYKGVRREKRSVRFLASITENGRKVSIGYFDDEKDAARAYNAAAIRLYGEFARINEGV